MKLYIKMDESDKTNMNIYLKLLFFNFSQLVSRTVFATKSFFKSFFFKRLICHKRSDEIYIFILYSMSVSANLDGSDVPETRHCQR